MHVLIRRSSWRVAAGGAPLVAAVIAGLALDAGGALGTAAAHASRRPDPAPARVTQTVKAPILGLIDKGSQGPYLVRRPFPTVDVSEVAPDARAFAGIVVNETWAQLEPTENHLTPAPLTRSLAAVAAYNRTHPDHPLAVKLRLWGGFTAPRWAKTLGGRPAVTFSTPTAAGTTGRWWSSAYRAAWSRFQHQLAADFDDDPLIRSVAVTSCATLTAEPFVQSPNPALHAELTADGWSSRAQQRCLLGAFADYSGWRHTPIDYAFNPFPDTAGARTTPDMRFTDTVMTRCADLLRSTGHSCILTNHDLTSSVTLSSSRSAPVYAEIDSLYARHRTAVDFQTGPPNHFGGCDAIDLAIAHHGQSLELWPPAADPKGFRGFRADPESQLVNWGRALRIQRRLRCSS